ncbi:hypothetical protein POUND7_000276 [Theobroma cacao]
MSTMGNSTNIFWQESPIRKLERRKLLNQKGCVVWITGLSGSGKSTLACSLSRELYTRGKLSYILDGDNLRHGLNKDLGFKADDRTENIRRVDERVQLKVSLEKRAFSVYAELRSIRINFYSSKPFQLLQWRLAILHMNVRREVAKLFADTGLICIASLISPYRKDRDACRAMLPDANFIEARLLEDGFTGIDDPYEPPLNCEIEIQQKDGDCPTPGAMAGEVVSYLEEKGYMQDH